MQVCDKYMNLNKVCPKNDYTLPKIELLDDGTYGHEILSLMDRYSATKRYIQKLQTKT